MITVFVKHKVNDYATWKVAFDNFSVLRREGGERSYRILHAINDPNDIALIFEWESEETAQEFMESTELKAAMIASGVCSEPYVEFAREYDRGTL